MIPILYKKSDTNYTRNGAGFLTDILSCSVSEERNGEYECTFTYPIDGRLYSEITEGDVIKAKANETSALQLFRVYSHSKPINGIVTFKAEHISYDANGIPIVGITATGVTPQAAITRAISAGAFASSFTAWSDISALGNIDIKEPCSLRAVLGGQQGSVLDVWGGEYEFDNYAIKLHQHRGADNGVTIEYGKNLTDVTQERNITETYTHIMPYAVYTSETDGDIVVSLTEKVLPLAIAENVGHQKAAIINFTDKFSENEPVTEQALRTKAAAFAQNSKLGTPKVNIKASFVSLWQTEEYKSIAPLERVKLCDTVTVRFAKLGVSAKAKVIKTVYDTITERYLSVEIGDVQSSFSDTVIAQNKAITDLAQVVRKGFSDASAELQAAIAEATAAITGNSGGYVVLYPAEHPQEILIMDSPDIATAVHVWRWNSSGLGYSSTGYNGTYGLAMTMNGAIVADYITTGTLNGGLLRADSVQANAISAGFKQSIADDINSTKTTVEQEFAAADAQLASTIYTKTETDTRISAAQAAAETAANGYTDTALGGYYTKSETETKIAQSASTIMLSVYTKTETDTAISTAQSAAETAANSYTNTALGSYYTKTETDSRISVSKDSILMTVSYAQSKYDTSTYPVDLYGYGAPAAAGYSAADHNGEYYLDQNNGKRYYSNGSAWSLDRTLSLITDTLQSEITANTTAISAKVSRGDVVSEINISSDAIRLTTAGRLIISAGNFQLDSSGNATLSNATLTGGTIQSSNYQAGTGGMSINLSSGAINTISGKFQLTSGGVIIAESATLTSATVTGTITTISGDYKTQLSSGQIKCYYNNIHVGNVGASHWESSTKQGMAFQLDADGDYMTWSCKDTSSQSSYTTIMTYTRGQIGTAFSDGEGLYIAKKLFVNSAAKFQSISVSGSASFSSSVSMSSNLNVYSYVRVEPSSSSTAAIKAYGQVNIERSSSTDDSLWIEKGRITVKDGGMIIHGNVCLYDNYALCGNYNDTNYNLAKMTSSGTCRIGHDDRPTDIRGSSINAGTNISFDDGHGVKLHGHIVNAYASNYVIFGNQFESTYVQGVSTNITSSHGNNTTVSSGNITYVSHGSGGNVNLVGTVLANGSPIATTSDLRRKNNIQPLAEKYVEMLKKIDPITFIYNDDISTSQRKHTGFIAQDVIEAMEAAEIDSSEFAGIIDLYKDGNEYALRYEEFISPLLAYVQHLEGRIAALERTG